MQSRSFEELITRLQKAKYIVKQGKYIAVKPQNFGSFIRLKSLGEFYSETALRNRLKAKADYEKRLARQIEDAQTANAPNLVVLKTMRFYMISFSGGYMPVRRSRPDHILTWENDAELNRLTALNAKIHRCDLWQGDIKYGPTLRIGGKVQPTYLSCLIDDATRYIIHAQFYGDMEQTIVEDTMKKGIQKYGVPRRIYFDNGSQYRTHWMKRTCGLLGIRLLYARPRNPQGKGHAERSS